MAALQTYKTNKEAIAGEAFSYGSNLEAYNKLTYNSNIGKNADYYKDPALMQKYSKEAGIDTPEGWDAFLNSAPGARPAPASGRTLGSGGIKSETINGSNYEIGSPAYNAAKAGGTTVGTNALPDSNGYTKVGGVLMKNGQPVMDIAELGKYYGSTKDSGPVGGNSDTSTQARMPGESIEDFTKRLGSTAGGATGTGSPAVGTSTALRLQDKAQAAKDALGLGNFPTAPDLFGSKDQKSLDLARAEKTQISTQLESIAAERMKLQEDFRKFSYSAGEGVNEAGRTGILSEAGRKVQDELDSLTRQETLLELKLGNRNAVISDLMASQKQEYADAVNQYNSQFSQSLQLINAFDKEQDDAKTNAKANLEVLSKSIQAQIEAGTTTFANLSVVQKSKIADLELQAGLPTGSTLAVLQTLKPGEEKVYAGVDDYGNFVYITKDANNVLKTQTLKGAVPQKPTGGGTPKTVPLLTNQQYSRLTEVGIDQGLADAIASDILGGVSLEDLRQKLKGNGQDPKILDKFDNVVGIASLLKNAKTNSGRSS